MVNGKVLLIIDLDKEIPLFIYLDEFDIFPQKKIY